DLKVNSAGRILPNEKQQANLHVEVARYHARFDELGSALKSLAAAVTIAENMDYTQGLLIAFRGHLREIVKLQLAIGDNIEARKTLGFSWSTLQELDRRGMVFANVMLNSKIEIAVHFVESGDVTSAMDVARSPN